MVMKDCKQENKNVIDVVSSRAGNISFKIIENHGDDITMFDVPSDRPRQGQGRSLA
jgi:hypothetical protein